jgi:hypothetical protein
MKRGLVGLWICLVIGGDSAAAERLETQSDRPYDWRIVVQFSPHPFFQPSYRARILQEIESALRPSLGELAEVQAIDLDSVPESARERLWQRFAAVGWRALSEPAARTLTGVKTHFLQIELRGSTFHLSARQHDGDTGLVSSVLQQRQTTAPEHVGRLAGLMLAPDFGVVGTVVDVDRGGQSVQIQLRGGKLAEHRPLIQRGEIFAVAVITQPVSRSQRPRSRPAGTEAEASPLALSAQPREFTLFRAVEPPTREGLLTCEILTRYTNPLPRVPGVLGFRCLKLTTVVAPVAIRIVGPDGRPPASGLPIRVRVTDRDFLVRPHPRDYLVLRDGLFRSDRPLQRVACVFVGLGGIREEQRFPLPILPGEQVYQLSYTVTAEEIARAAFERQCEELRGQIAEAWTGEKALFATLAKLIDEGRNPEALQRATAGAERLKTTAEHLSAALARLKSQPGAAEAVPAALLASSESLLESLNSGVPRLQEQAERLKQAIDKARDPVRFEKEFRARELLGQIKQHLEFGEVPEALMAYDALFQLTEQADVKQRRDALAAEWQAKSPEHAAARDFLQKDWRNASTVEQFKHVAPSLKESVRVLIAHNDRYGLRALLSAIEPAHARIKQMTDLLDPNSDVDRPALRDLQTVVNIMLEVESAAREKLKQLEATMP